MDNNINRISIDAYKHRNLICDYCNKHYLRYGAFMNHIEKCKHKTSRNLVTKSQCHPVTPENTNHQNSSDIMSELVHLRREVSELRDLITTLVNNNTNPSNNSINILNDCIHHSVSGCCTPDHNKQQHSEHKLIINNRSLKQDKQDKQDKLVTDKSISSVSIPIRTFEKDTPCENIIPFNEFISKLDFCNQSQLLDIFDSDDLIESFLFLWNECISRTKYLFINIPIRNDNGRIYIFQNNSWILFEIEQAEKMISYLHDKILQQLSIYQSDSKIKKRIANEPTFRDYYLNQVTRISSNPFLKHFQSSPHNTLIRLACNF